mgnify:FL=1|jgi:hypothetical protein
MRRRNLFNISFRFLLFIGIFLSSCSKNDLEKENIASATRMLTFDVSQSFNENPDESARGLSVKPDTVHQQFDMGLEVEAFVEEDKTDKSRSNIETIAAGTKVLAFVIDAVYSKIYRIQELEITSDNKLICEVPDFETYIVFYSYNSTELMPSTTLKEGDNISAASGKRNMEQYTTDVMWAKTELITTNTINLGTIKFAHLFSRARICLHCDIGISGFTSVLSNSGWLMAAVDMINGNAGAVEGNRSSLHLDSNEFTSPQTIIYSSYKTLIPSSRLWGQLNLIINNTGITRTIGNINCNFKAGYSYTIHVNIKNNKIVAGWTPNYFQWDAKAPFLPNKIPTSGDDSYHSDNTNSAKNSCIGCPSFEDAQRMLNSGIYWDDKGPSWTAYDGTSYSTGFWVMKKSKWGDTGNITQGKNIPVNKADNTQRYSDDYVFLPASGFIAQTTLVAVGEGARYWVFGQYNLVFSNTYASINYPTPLYFGSSVCRF